MSTGVLPPPLKPLTKRSALILNLGPFCFLQQNYIFPDLWVCCWRIIQSRDGSFFGLILGGFGFPSLELNTFVCIATYDTYMYEYHVCHPTTNCNGHKRSSASDAPVSILIHTELSFPFENLQRIKHQNETQSYLFSLSFFSYLFWFPKVLIRFKNQKKKLT